MKDFEKIREIQNQTYKPAKGTLWRHYKGGLYEVVGCSMEESTQEFKVIYNNVDHPMPHPWSRPLKEWSEDVNGEPRYKPAGQYKGQNNE